MVILLIFFILSVLLFLLILLSPLKISLNLNLKKLNITGSGSLAIINSNFLYMTFDYNTHKVSVVFIGKPLKKEKKNKRTKDKNVLSKREQNINKPTIILEENRENRFRDDNNSNLKEEIRKDDNSVSIEDKLSDRDEHHDEEEVDSKKKSDKKEANKLKIVFSLFTDSRYSKWRKKFFNWIKRGLFSLFRLIKFERFFLCIYAGLEDPAYVGFLCSAYHLLNGMVQHQGNNSHIEFFPVFTKNHFEFSSNISFKTSLLRIILPFFLIFFTFPYIDTFFMWRKIRHNYQ